MKQKLLFLFFLASLNFYGQTVEILGKVTGVSDVENIHVINKTGQAYTVTDAQGEFKLRVRLHDTIVFTSIRYKLQEIVVSNETVLNKAVLVKLNEQVNQLDTVIVGKILTGDLLSDIKNTKGDRPLNFFDVGIPGYTGRIATINERQLSEASGFNPGLGSSGYGLGASVGFTPIINAISGRTKMLKRRVKIEQKDGLMHSIKSRLGKDFFASNPLDEDKQMDFFYFCSDDANFIKYCKNQNDFKVLVFLRMKYKQYLENIKP
ncbi:hypothetical protein SAMN04489722_10766 [Algibacter lectus]|uniref:hypothetical protein n=1 Tax=Algibacter lectus TaxID=221126 RepID=UPI0008EEB01E|nr:hypothetical protein [Algibacter lectus]SFD30198.1 hypothetical protein SAMN04489722_10766 [Algibacter lectus]